LCDIAASNKTTKTGVVYEKRLIEQYINEHGTEPSTGDALAADDLLPINSSRIVRPRPPTLTSIPALLATFQNEWDSLALETYNLREQLARTREELATALYQHDAAVRVIARLSKERDEARDSLSKITVSGGAANGDAMVVDSTEALPDNLAAQVDELHATYVSFTLDPESVIPLTHSLDFPRAARSDLSLMVGLPPARSRHLRSKLPQRCLLHRRRPSIPKAATQPLVASRAKLPYILLKPISWSAKFQLESQRRLHCGPVRSSCLAPVRALLRCLKAVARLALCQSILDRPLG
jgi:pre-mRNA-processing factor 19